MKIRFGSVGASVVLFRCWKSVCEKNHSKINKSLLYPDSFWCANEVSSISRVRGSIRHTCDNKWVNNVIGQEAFAARVDDTAKGYGEVSGETRK